MSDMTGEVLFPLFIGLLTAGSSFYEAIFVMLPGTDRSMKFTYPGTGKTHTERLLIIYPIWMTQ